MKKERAEAYYHSPVILCPLCEHLEGIDGLEGNVDETIHDAMKRMIKHLIKKHTDEEAIDLLGWVD